MELLEGRGEGLLALLDEEGRVPGGCAICASHAWLPVRVSVH